MILNKVIFEPYANRGYRLVDKNAKRDRKKYRVTPASTPFRSDFLFFGDPKIVTKKRKPKAKATLKPKLHPVAKTATTKTPAIKTKTPRTVSPQTMNNLKLLITKNNKTKK